MAETIEQSTNPILETSEHLIYEFFDGVSYYRKGYSEVLTNKKTIDEIMGTSSLQFFIINYLIRLFAKNLDEDLYYIATNEAGLHIERNSNLANDIAIYETAVLTPDKISDKYADVPPKLVVEVDVKVEQTEGDYIQLKTKKMLAFGVEKVVWIFTKSQTIMVATANEDWKIMDWNKPFNLILGIEANLGLYLQKKKVRLS